MTFLASDENLNMGLMTFQFIFHLRNGIRIVFMPFLSNLLHDFISLFFASCMVDLLEIRRECLLIFLRDILQGISDLVNDATLVLCIREYHVDGIRSFRKGRSHIIQGYRTPLYSIIHSRHLVSIYYFHSDPLECSELLYGLPWSLKR